MATQELSLSAAQLREVLTLSQSVTQDASQLLDLCSQHLKDLDRTVQPLTARTVSLTKARDNIKKARERAEEVLDHLDASRKVQGVIQEGPRTNLQAFLAALGKLEGAIEYLQAHQRHMTTAADALGHAVALRDRAVEAAGLEFAALLGKHSGVPPGLLAMERQLSKALESQEMEQDLSSLIVDMLPESVLPKLHALAQAQLRNGSRSCVKTYTEARKQVILQCLEPLLAGVGSREDVARLPAWRQAESRIPMWEAAVKLLLRCVQEEARLCAAVFPPAEQPQVLQQVVAPAGHSVADAGDAILAGKRVPDKLFGLLGMHDTLAAALPTLRATLASQQSSRLERASAGMNGAPAPPAQPLSAAVELEALGARVGAEIRASFAQLQEAYGSGSSGASSGGGGGMRGAAEGLPPDATLHPMCASTVAALKRLLSYGSALPVLFGEGGVRDVQGGGGGLQEEARLLERMAKAVTDILVSLLSTLDARARAGYRSRAQAALHMLNNAQFVCHAAGGKDLKAVGEAWLEAHKDLVERYRREYMDACWSPLVSLLQADMQQPTPSAAQLERGGGRQAIKDKWTAANKILDAAMTQQGSWTVVDANLRYSLKDSITEAVLPLYKAFTERYMAVPFTENRSKYIRFSIGTLHNFLAHELFEKGSTGGSGSRQGSPNMGRNL